MMEDQIRHWRKVATGLIDAPPLAIELLELGLMPSCLELSAFGCGEVGGSVLGQIQVGFRHGMELLRPPWLPRLPWLRRWKRSKARVARGGVPGGSCEFNC